jgi:hypothetical protein
METKSLDKKKKSIKVKEMYKFLGKLIKEGKGDYKMKIDLNEYYVSLKRISVIDESTVCENKTINVS